ncbi:MAG: hypothetical protein JXR37_16640 [Kiritimatiellae bacterium]|nr:hypothetical protein [Kiritimatiellia bacterium]
MSTGGTEPYGEPDSPAPKVGGGGSELRDPSSVAALLVLLVSIPVLAAASYLLAGAAIDPRYGVGALGAAGVVLLGLGAFAGRRSPADRSVYELVQGGIVLFAFLAMFNVAIQGSGDRLGAVLAVLVATLVLFGAMLAFYRRFRG